MYEADGIDLTKSQYEILRALERCGGIADESMLQDARADTFKSGSYERLASLGFITIGRSRTQSVDGIYLNGEARDWIASYDYSVRKSHQTTFREVLLAVWSVIGGAAAGGVVTYLLFRWYGIA